MKYHNLVYCKHKDNDTRAFLYELPLDVSVDYYDKLCVKDKRGEHIVTAFSNNWISEDWLTELICTANGGYYPPAKVIGKVETEKIMVSREVVKKFGEEEAFIPF